MNRYVAFLRAINVSGHAVIKMQELKKLFEIPGFKNVNTFIQSGNVIFDATSTDIKSLHKKIEKRLGEHFGFDVGVFLLSINDLVAIEKNNPFKKVKAENAMIYVNFLNEKPEPEKVKLLESFSNEIETFKVIGFNVYALVYKGVGKERFSNMFIEQKLKQPSTGRNMNTVGKIIELYSTK